MFRFSRERILPFFLKRKEPVYQLARRANCSPQTIWRALNGFPISSKAVGKIADALGVDTMEFLEIGGTNMFTKKKILIEGTDGKKDVVEISVDDETKTVAAWGDDDEIHKAFEQYFSEEQSDEKILGMG